MEIPNPGNFITPNPSANDSSAYGTNFNPFESSPQDRLNDPLGFSARYSAWQADLDRKYNASEVEKARQYNTEMSNTAYQRSMSDMRKAGLNPYLAYNQGGSTTVGSPSATSSGARISASNSYALANKQYQLDLKKYGLARERYEFDQVQYAMNTAFDFFYKLFDTFVPSADTIAKLK